MQRNSKEEESLLSFDGASQFQDCASDFNQSALNYFNQRQDDMNQRAIDDHIVNMQLGRVSHWKNTASGFNDDFVEYNDEAEGQNRGPKQLYPKQLFTEVTPVIGRVPILFFIPKCKGVKTLKKLIHDFGGICVDQVECCTVQVLPESAIDPNSKEPHKAVMDQFSKGFVISYRWIIDSIHNEKIIDRGKYIVGDEIIEGGKQISFSRTKFTIREIMKIYDVVAKNPQKRTKNPVYWNQFIQRGIFPGRSVHSINAQWQRFCNNENVEDSVNTAIKLKMPYCISFREIPDQEEVIKSIIKSIKQRKQEVLQMEKLRHVVLQSEIAPYLKQSEMLKIPASLQILDESDDEEQQANCVLNSIGKQQASLILPLKEMSNKKQIQELMKIKEEPKSKANTAFQQALISKTYLKNTTNILSKRAKANGQQEEPKSYKRPKLTRKASSKRVLVRNVSGQEPESKKDKKPQSEEEEEEELVNGDEENESEVDHRINFYQEILRNQDEEQVAQDPQSNQVRCNEDDSSIFGLGLLKKENKLKQIAKEVKQESPTEKPKKRKYTKREDKLLLKQQKQQEETTEVTNPDDNLSTTEIKQEFMSTTTNQYQNSFIKVNLILQQHVQCSII